MQRFCVGIQRLYGAHRSALERMRAGCETEVNVLAARETVGNTIESPQPRHRRMATVLLR